MEKTVERIAELPLPEILCKLAEEAAELAQAALKVRRAMTGTNPTPVKYHDAIDKMVEEAADVESCLEVLYRAKIMDLGSVQARIPIKLERWAGRVNDLHAKTAGADGAMAHE